MVLSWIRDLLCCLASVAFVATSGAFAQSPKETKETSGVTRPETSTPPPGNVREVKPETYYLRDKDGRLVPMLNLSYEEFVRLYGLDLKLSRPGTTLPPYSLQDLSIKGHADQRQAELTVVVSLRVQSEGWVRVPLRFADAVLRESPEQRSEGDFFLDYEKDGGGYVCWIRGVSDKLQTLSLRFTVPVREVGNESRLALQTPRATSSQLELRVPLPDAAASVSNGVLEVSKQGPETQFVVAGVGGDFQIVWRRGDAKLASQGPLLDVRNDTTVTIESLRQVNADIRLKVRSLRGELDAFLVRLPAGMRLLPRQYGGQTGIRVTETSVGEAPATKAVQVMLDRPTLGPVEVQLLTEMTPAADAKNPEFDFSGLEVNDTGRQLGTIDFVIKGDWLVAWKPGANVQRTLVPDSLKQKVAARFEYPQKAFSLRIQVSQKETAVSVEPLYILHFDANRVRLDARLRYKVRGTGVSGVNLQLPGWRVLNVLPEHLIDSDTLDREKVDPLFIPLAPSALSGSDEFQLRIGAEQEIPDISKTVSLTLPRPDAKTLLPATVVVIPADNVELNVADGELQGLERESEPPPNQKLAVGQQTPWYFRERSDAKMSVFAANLRIRPRAVSVTLATTLNLDLSRVRVEQHLGYHITNEPLESILLDVPRQLLESARLRILCEQQALSFIEVPPDGLAKSAEVPSEPEKSAATTARVKVGLLGERIGHCELVVQYETSLPASSTEQEAVAAVPLVLPALESHWVLAGNTLQLRANDSLQVRVDGKAWEVANNAAAPSESLSNELLYEANELRPAAAVGIRRKAGSSQGSILVRQAWVQSWLAVQGRRDRAVFRISANRNRVTIQLPAGAELEDVALDGRQVPDTANGEPGTVLVQLPAGPSPREHVIELWYTVDVGCVAVGSLTLKAPRLQDAKWANKWYWQIALPPDVHLLSYPLGTTPELTWQRAGALWTRRPVLTQVELERWLGATSQDPLPDTLNLYLFSSFGEVGQLQCLAAVWWTILAAASGCALLGGLLLLYIPLLRHPCLLFVAGAALLVLVSISPDLATLAGQASGLGLILLVLALLLKWLVGWRQAKRPVVRGVSLPGPDSKTARASTASAPAEASPPPTTSTAPVVLHLPIAESKP